MGFPRQEYWSGFRFPSPEVFLTQGLEDLHLLHFQADSLSLSHLGNLLNVCVCVYKYILYMIMYFI